MNAFTVNTHRRALHGSRALLYTATVVHAGKGGANDREIKRFGPLATPGSGIEIANEA